jgi:putative autoinducer-2 (AI-2) aldolase
MSGLEDDEVPGDTGFHNAHSGGEDDMVGKKSRMQRLFNEESGKSLTIAVDHGAALGPVKGVEKVEEVFSRLDPWADAWLMSKGILKQCFEPDGMTGVVLRATGAITVAQGFPGGEGLVVSVEEALTLGGDALAATIFIGTTYERDSLLTLARVAESCERWQMPLVAVLGAGVVHDRTLDAEFWALGARVAAEHGADLVCTYWVEEGFEKVVEGCPVPVLVSGGMRQGDLEGVLSAVGSALAAGAQGIVAGPELWQAKYPEATAEALAMAVHKGANVAEAMDAYRQAERGASPSVR